MSDEASDTNRLIENLVKDYGPVMYLEQLPRVPILEKFAERAIGICDRTSLTLDDRSPVHFRYLGFSQLNAMAATGIVDLVVVSLSAPLVVFSNFARIMASPALFLGIGDPSLEAEALQLTKLQTTVASLSATSGPIPNCPVRQVFATLLARTAFDWIIGHEVGHIARGHHGICGLTRPSFIVERGNGVEPGNMALQVAELDADFIGLTHAMYGANNLRLHLAAGRPYGSQEQERAAVAAFGTAELTFKHALMAVWTLLRLFDEDLRTPFASRSHPPLPLRRTNILEVAWRFATLAPFKIDRDRAVALAEEAVSLADAALYKICSAPLVTPQLDSILAEHGSRLRAYGDELSAELVKNQRGGFGGAFAIVL